MRCHKDSITSFILPLLGIPLQLATLVVASPLSHPQIVNNHNLHINIRTTQPSPACDALLDIIDSYGTLEGTLGGAQILIPNLGSNEAGTIIRQFMTLLDSAILNVWSLFDAVPCKRYQAPVGDEGDGIVPPTVTFTSRAMGRSAVMKRQGESSAVVCTVLAQVSDDVQQTVSLMSRLAGAKGLPAQLYIDPLQEAVDDAKVKIGVVEKELKATSGC